MWHQLTQPWIQDDKLVVLGIVQEQHAERARLYKQWKKLDWPIAQDAFNLSEIAVVPLAIALDEQGVVRSHRALPKFTAEWLDETGQPPLGSKPAGQKPMARPHHPAVAQLLWHPDTQLDSAIEKLSHYLATDAAEDASTHFRAGVAYRMRFDKVGNPEDFQAAINHWSRALELNPNQYIYRRRIQQYGARLGKPYPFYDWIAQANTEIRDRGEQPVPLTAALSGAEIARPVRDFAPSPESTNPDADAKINLDAQGLVSVNVVVAPQKIKPGQATRVHVLMKPREMAKWNNEAEPTQLWIDKIGDGVELSAQLIKSEMPAEAESTELRRFEFEAKLPLNATSDISIPAYTLYYVCLNDSGQCLILRKNLEIKIAVDR